VGVKKSVRLFEFFKLTNEVGLQLVLNLRKQDGKPSDDNWSLTEMKESVSVPGIRSQNAFTEEAIKGYISRTRQEMPRQSYLQAIRNLMFLKDIEAVEEDFQQADDETAGMIR
jgi:hypothetical protein